MATQNLTAATRPTTEQQEPSLKWEGVQVEVLDGTYAWEFNGERPWLVPDESGLQIAVMDCKSHEDVNLVAIHLEDLLENVVGTFADQQEDVPRLLASAESLERMALAFRHAAARLVGAVSTPVFLVNAQADALPIPPARVVRQVTRT